MPELHLKRRFVERSPAIVLAGTLVLIYALIAAGCGSEKKSTAGGGGRDGATEAASQADGTGKSDAGESTAGAVPEKLLPSLRKSSPVKIAGLEDFKTLNKLIDGVDVRTSQSACYATVALSGEAAEKEAIDLSIALAKKVWKDEFVGLKVSLFNKSGAPFIETQFRLDRTYVATSGSRTLAEGDW